MPATATCSVAKEPTGCGNRIFAVCPVATAPVTVKPAGNAMRTTPLPSGRLNVQLGVAPPMEASPSVSLLKATTSPPLPASVTVRVPVVLSEVATNVATSAASGSVTVVLETVGCPRF